MWEDLLKTPKVKCMILLTKHYFIYKMCWGMGKTPEREKEKKRIKPRKKFPVGLTFQPLPAIRGHNKNADERNNLKLCLWSTRKLLETKLVSRFHRRDKRLDGTSYKIFWSICEEDRGRTSINGPEKKKTNDDARGLISQRWHRLYVSQRLKNLVCPTIYP